MDKGRNLDALAPGQRDGRARRNREIERAPVTDRRNVADQVVTVLQVGEKGTAGAQLPCTLARIERRGPRASMRSRDRKKRRDSSCAREILHVGARQDGTHAEAYHGERIIGWNRGHDEFLKLAGQDRQSSLRVGWLEIGRKTGMACRLQVMSERLHHRPEIQKSVYEDDIHELLWR